MSTVGNEDELVDDDIVNEPIEDEEIVEEKNKVLIKDLQLCPILFLNINLARIFSGKKK